MRSIRSFNRFSVSFYLLLLVGGAVSFYGQSGKCAEARPDPGPLRHFEILQNLRSGGDDKRTADSSSEYLTGEIKKRGVDFALYKDLTIEIRKSGGTDKLLAAIDEAIPTERKPRLREVTRLDKIIRDNYYRNSTLRLAIDAGKEFLEKYSDEPGYCEMVVWIRSQLPNWHKRIEHYQQKHIGPEVGLTPRIQNHNI